MGCVVSSGGWSVREIVNEDEFSECLRLRFDALCGDLGYCFSWVKASEQMRDVFDDGATQVGVFDNQQRLVAAARLVDNVRSPELPTSSQLPSGLWSEFGERWRIGEVSRVVVAPGYRRRGLFVRLLATMFLAAKSVELEGLLISERSNEAYASQLERFGFRAIRADYWFVDQRIAPKVLTTSYLAMPLREPEFYLSQIGISPPMVS